MPPPFAPTHAWVCPIWRWSHWRVGTSTWASTTVLHVANSWSAPISIHVDCYLSDGTPEPGVTVSGNVAARHSLKAALNPTREPTMSASGDFNDGGDGWFELWANGPVTPAAMTLVILAPGGGWSPMELVVPVRRVEIEPAAAEVTPPHVEVEAAPEGGGGAAEARIEAPLSVPEAVAWFDSVRSGGRFHPRDT